MLPKVNLVLMVFMAAFCGARSLKELQICRRSYEAQGEDTFYNQNNSLLSEPDSTNDTQELEVMEELKKLQLLNERGERLEGRGRKKMDRMLMSLIIAYKMKFMALIPTLIGAIVLLFASNALVGFFFALFAAVVSMKGR